MKNRITNPPPGPRTILTKLGGLLLLIPFLVSTAAAQIYVEDFEAPDGSAGYDPRFNHEFSPIAPLDYYSSGFADLTEGHGLGIYPATDLITFNLDPGQYVTYASADVRDYASGSSVEFIGTEGSFTFAAHYPIGETFSTLNLSIGTITGIRLTSFEGIYDNIAITVVPEPAAVVLFGAGLVIVFRRSRRGCIGRAHIPGKNSQ